MRSADWMQSLFRKNSQNVYKVQIPAARIARGRRKQKEGIKPSNLALAVNQSHIPPTQYTDLITGSADCHGLSLGCYAMALVDIIDARTIPDSTCAAVGLYRIDCFSSGFALYALGGHLPTALVGYDLTVFEGKTIVVGELANSSNVNHDYSSLSRERARSLSFCIYYTTLCLICQGVLRFYL